MNLPNKLTLFRVVLVPFFIMFLLWTSLPYNYLFAMIIFVVASLTDFVDGYLARKNNQITTFGKFLDPLADKVLVLSALLCFISLSLASPVAVAIIVAREFMVTSIRLVAVSANGKVIAASMIGKVKTVIQMIAIIVPLILLTLTQTVTFELPLPLGAIAVGLNWISAIFTAYSGIVYLWQNRHIINIKD